MRREKASEAGPVRHTTHCHAADDNDSLILNFRDISHTMRFLYEGKGSQKRILIVLSKTGPITQRALTERLGIQPGSASEVIAKLESADLVKRTPCESDRRTADIALTEKGKVLALQAAEQRRLRHLCCFLCLKRSTPTGKSDTGILKKRCTPAPFAVRCILHVEIYKTIFAVCPACRSVYDRRGADGFDPAWNNEQDRG